MLLLDLTHTSHTRARTGIQRVARALWRHLGREATPITRDPYLGDWRALERWELLSLQESGGGAKRKAQWPTSAKWRGWRRRFLGSTEKFALAGRYDGLIESELFGAPVARDFPRLFARVHGPRVAVFMDAIPLRYPELSPPRTVGRFPAYLQELAQFDGIAAISEESRDSLVSFWQWAGISHPPPVIALPLGVDPVQRRTGVQKATTSQPPVVLCVGTLEGRKNHLALLEACEQLWSSGQQFQLRIIGHANAETGGAALARLRELQSAGRPLRYDGPSSDESIAEAYAECAFTAYPSIAEGFGLPVIESLEQGKPCVCSARGATGEISRGGGCVGLEALDAAAIASGLRRLLTSPTELAELSAIAQRRTFKTWADYTRELVSWLQTLPRR